jgi:hypothetical protein
MGKMQIFHRSGRYKIPLRRNGSPARDAKRPILPEPEEPPPL